MSLDPLFGTYFLAGFECSSHVRRDGRRLDLIAATHHDRLALADYRLAKAHGMSAMRDGLRWHLIERGPRRYDWSSFLPMLRAAREAKVEIAWDLLHYGLPEGLNVFSAAFVERYVAFVRAATRLIREETGGRVIVCPINEISFFAWAGGEMGHWQPVHKGRSRELKRQLARAAIQGASAIREICPKARLLWAEPAIHVVPRARSSRVRAEAYRLSQYEAFDMICGRAAPELGGRPDLLDIVGVNYYPHNQWYHSRGPTIPMGACDYRPFRDILGEIHERYRRPMIIAETGGECSGRAAWLHYVGQEVRMAAADGIPVGGMCLYPITAYPGWSNDRRVPTGLFSEPDADGRRKADPLLAAELARQAELFREAWRGRLRGAA